MLVCITNLVTGIKTVKPFDEAMSDMTCHSSPQCGYRVGRCMAPFSVGTEWEDAWLPSVWVQRVGTSMASFSVGRERRNTNFTWHAAYPGVGDACSCERMHAPLSKMLVWVWGVAFLSPPTQAPLVPLTSCLCIVHRAAHTVRCSVAAVMSDRVHSCCNVRQSMQLL